jgi:hypothetical protein
MKFKPLAIYRRITRLKRLLIFIAIISIFTSSPVLAGEVRETKDIDITLAVETQL